HPGRPMKTLTTLAAAFAALPMLAFAQEDVTPDTVVATVAGQEITVTHVLDIRRQLPAQYQNLPVEVLFTGIVDQLIQQRVLALTVGKIPHGSMRRWRTSAPRSWRASLWRNWRSGR
ncbi:MAG: hypothetical protein AAF618_02310, partial [Pseudomonadota bacterium]